MSGHPLLWIPMASSPSWLGKIPRIELLLRYLVRFAIFLQLTADSGDFDHFRQL